MSELLAGRSWKGAFMTQHRAGHPMIVHVEGIPVLHEGRVIGVVGVSRPKSRG